MNDNNELGQSVRSRANSEDELGRTPADDPRGENRAIWERLLPHPHNSAPNLPASVFFGTSGVPGDGYAADELNC